MLDIFKMVIEQLLQNKLRLIGATMTIFFSTTFVFLVLSFSDGFVEGMNQNIENRFPTLARTINCKIEGNNEETVGMSIFEIDTFLNTCPNYITDIIRVSEKAAKVTPMKKKEENYSLYGVSEGYEKYKNIKIIAGDFFSNEDCKINRKCIVVPETFAKGINSDIRKCINTEVDLYFQEENKITKFYIVGIYASTKDAREYIYCPYTILEHQKYWMNIKLLVSSRDDLEDSYLYIKKYLKNRKTKDSTYKYGCIMNNMVAMIRNIMVQIKTLFTIIASLSMLMSAIGVSNIIMFSVTERKQELGIKRAIGCSHKKLREEILLETTIISCIGGILSILSVNVILIFVNKNMEFILHCFGCAQYNIKIDFTIGNLVITLFMIFFVSFVASYYPARQVENMTIINALERE